MRNWFTLAAATGALIGCGDASPSSNEQGKASILEPLPETAQAERLQACMKKLQHYRDLGVIRHGGAKPGVARSAWDELKPDEQNEIFETAACISSAGQIGEKIVTITEEGGFPDIETRRVSNDHDIPAQTGPSS